ncbi:MAG TPA: hypothetical protein VIV55_09940 [Flavobacterium sp.]
MNYPIPDTKVNYETALLAKEQTFDEVCYYHFGSDGVEFPSIKLEGGKNSQWAKCVARPTQAHLQKWLRKRHHIHVYCVVSDKGLPFYDVWVVKGDVRYKSEDDEYVYEESLEVGLQIGLKWIKDVETTKQKKFKTQ